VWRRLQQVGAVVLRNSLYVLPVTNEAREDFSWVREEIVSSGGQVSVLEAAAVDGYTDNELIQQFRSLRSAEYEALAAEIRAVDTQTSKAERRTSPARRQRTVTALRERFTAIQARDYFNAAGRALVEQALNDLERRDRSQRHPAPPMAKLRAAGFRRRTWVTRPRPGIDRFACAWLIRRFIDPSAKFAFVSNADSVHADQLSFDMPNVQFGHHGTQCSVETLLDRFDIHDKAALALSRVVHDLDLKESRFAMPETIAVGRLVEGLRSSFRDDAQLLEQGIVVMEALYRSFADSHSGKGRSPNSRHVSRKKR
jgi:hypothetical protein